MSRVYVVVLPEKVNIVCATPLKAVTKTIEILEKDYGSVMKSPHDFPIWLQALERKDGACLIRFTNGHNVLIENLKVHS